MRMNFVHSTRQPLDIRQLRAFVALAKSGSFTRAGAELCVSQSAVSHSIKGLESDTDCRLFDRLGKKVHLTPAGEHLLHHAERILREMAMARRSLESRASWGKGSLRVAADGFMLRQVMPAVIGEFLREFPQGRVSLEASDPAKWPELFREQRLDLAFGPLLDRSETLSFTPLFTEELGLFVGAKHPWAALAQVPLEEFEEQTLLVDCRTSAGSLALQNYLNRERVHPASWVELGSVEAVMTMASLDLGVGVMPCGQGRTEGEARRLGHVPWGRRKPKQTWGVLRGSERISGLAETAFLRFLKIECKKRGGIRGELVTAATDAEARLATKLNSLEAGPQTSTVSD